MTEISEAALSMGSALICAFEGCRLRPYRDVRGIWTIGFGNIALLDGSRVTSSTAPLTPAEATALHEATIRLLRPRLAAMLQVPTTDHQAAALISFQYNEGSGALASSTLLHLLNAGRSVAAAGQFSSWVYTRIDGVLTLEPGLVRRRGRERSVFLGGALAGPELAALRLEPTEIDNLRH